MKIWQIDPANLTPYYNLALSQALAEQGHDVRYITTPFLYDKNLVYPQNITTDFHYFNLIQAPIFLNLPRVRKLLRGVLYPIYHRQLLEKIRQHRPDVVHIQWSRLPIFDGWLIKNIRAMGIPVVHTVHDVDPLFSQGRFTGNLEDVYRQVDALIVHTEDSKKRFVEHYPGARSVSIHIIPHLVPVTDADKAYIPAEKAKEKARERLGIPPDVPVVLFFGIIKPYKGLSLLADAVARMREQHPKMQVWVVGHPDSAEDQTLVETLAQQPNFYVRPGFVPSDEVWVYHVAADVIVFPYRNIFQSGALIKALVYGRAVIVTDVGGLPEAVNGNGWIVPPENADALAQTLVEAVSDPARLAQMGQVSLEIIKTLYDPAAVAAHFISVYQTLKKQRA